MDANGVAARQPLQTYEQLAKLIDHSLVRPDLTDEHIADGCRIAAEYQVASVAVRPSDVEFAVRQLEGSGVAAGSVCGFPHGSSTTAVKLYETRDLLRRGAREIDAVVNTGKLLSRQFQYVESEIQQLAATCHEQGAILKVILENAFLTDELKIVACRICSRARADFVKTSTGFAPSGYSLHDLVLMRKHCGPDVGITAAGGVRTLEKALEVYRVGADRFGATATVVILDAWKKQLAEASAIVKG